MRILANSESLGVLMYSTPNWKGEQVYTVVYGLQVTQWDTFRKALDDYGQCMIHASIAEGLGEE